jgi:hypothetical protein
VWSSRTALYACSMNYKGQRESVRNYINVVLVLPNLGPGWFCDNVTDPDPNVFGPPGSGSGSISQRHGSGSFYHQAKIGRKTLIPTVLLLLFDFLSLKNDVNVHLKSNMKKNFLLAS